MDQGPLVLNLAKIDWSVQIFWKFSLDCVTCVNFQLLSSKFKALDCVTCVNFQLLSSKFVYECTNS